MSLKDRLKKKYSKQEGVKRGEVIPLPPRADKGPSRLPRVGVREEMPRTRPIHDWDFSKLTEEETEIMNYVAFSGYGGGIPPNKENTVRLLTLDLLKTVADNEGNLEYWMDLYVHMLWCLHIGESDEDPRR